MSGKDGKVGEDHEMENDNLNDGPSTSGQQKKRNRTVGPDGVEVQKNKRARVEGINEVNKEKAFNYIYWLTISTATTLKLVLSYYMERPYLAMGLFHIMFCIHQYGRQKRNVADGVEFTGRLKKMTDNTQSYRVGNIVINVTRANMDAILNAVETQLKLNGEQYSDHHLIMCHIELFYDRSKELQIGADKLVLNKRDGDTFTLDLTRLGVPKAFRHLAGGCSWSEHLRSTLSEYTTGLCQALMISKHPPGGTDKYVKKNVVAMKRAFNFIPEIGPIAQFLKDNTMLDNLEIITALCHVSAVHPNKHKRRITPCFAYIWSVMTTYDAKGETWDKKYIYNAASVSEICFSSKKGSLLYNKCSGLNWRGIPDTAKMACWLYHCTMGTASEDIGVLKATTTQANWLHRKEMREFFTDVKRLDHHTVINPIKLVYYPKSIIGAQTGMLARGSNTLGCVPMTGGYRVKCFSELLLGGEATIAINGHGKNAILEYLAQIQEILSHKKKLMGSGGKIKPGTTPWYRIDTASIIKGVNGTPMADMVVREVGLTFWSNKD